MAERTCLLASGHRGHLDAHDLTGAAVAQASAGDGARHVVVPLALAAMIVASWALRPEDCKLEQGLSR